MKFVHREHDQAIKDVNQKLTVRGGALCVQVSHRHEEKTVSPPSVFDPSSALCLSPTWLEETELYRILSYLMSSWCWT